MTLLPYLMVVCLLAGVFVRWTWVLYMRACWVEVVVLYAGNVRLRDTEVVRLVEMWPTWLVVAQFWRWHYRDFIVDQQGVGDLIRFFEQPPESS